MTEIEKALQDDMSIGLYLSEVSTKQFRIDCDELIKAYSDNGVIDKAIKLLESCRSIDPHSGK